MASWESVEKLLASGDPNDTLIHLASLDKLLSTSKATPPLIPSVSIGDEVLNFHYLREYPVEECSVEDTVAQDDRSTHKEVIKPLIMSSRKYVDVLECFSPYFAGPSCLMDIESTITSSPSLLTPQPPPTTMDEIITSLRGRSKDEVVPLLITMDIPTESKVDIALQYFASTNS